jgi:hypothetical protein
VSLEWADREASVLVGAKCSRTEWFQDELETAPRGE